jgi:nitrous oxide reductase accessory protein NosL
MRIFYIFLFFLSFTFLSLHADSSEISQTIKEKKIYPMGKKIFEKGCDTSFDIHSFSTSQELQHAILEQHVCKSLSSQQLESLILYLWDVKRLENSKDAYQAIHVHQDEKCPVCGMYVYKYPRWAAQIIYQKRQLSFDGVKDMMKFYFDSAAYISDDSLHINKHVMILVTDYYTQRTIRAKDAYYVLGSDVYGPMGNELIPFAKLDDAKTFYMDHKGAKIINFNEITKEDVYKLDE